MSTTAAPALPLKVASYHTLTPGPHLVILGAVHGNERCGPEAIHSVMAQLDSGTLTLTRGRLSLVPVCNPRAYTENVRCVERNLNRYLYPKDTPETYEDHIDPVLCRVLDEADALLDLHSYGSEGGAFCFLGTGSAEELAFSRALGVRDFVYGWSEAFGSSNPGNPYESMGTTEYTRHKGGIAATVECGHHHNDDNVAVATRAILNALVHMQMIAPDAAHTAMPAPHAFTHSAKPDGDAKPRCVKMQRVFYKKHPGALARRWKHYDFVRTGEVLATYDDGTQITAPEDGYIVLPKYTPDLGAEWFYFGIATPFPAVLATPKTEAGTATRA